MKKTFLALAAATFASGAVAAPQPASQTVAPEAAIAFPDRTVRNFRPAGWDTLYLETIGGKWYRATLMIGCRDLPYARAIAFDTGGSSALDRFAQVLVEGDRCPIQSLVRVDGPPADEEES